LKLRETSATPMIVHVRFIGFSCGLTPEIGGGVAVRLERVIRPAFPTWPAFFVRKLSGAAATSLRIIAELFVWIAIVNRLFARDRGVG
jgi:hypothetical protein